MKDLNRIINRIGILILGMMIPFLGMLSCTDQSQPLLDDPNTPNLRNEPFLIIVHDYDTMRDMHGGVRDLFPGQRTSPEAIGYMIRGRKSGIKYDICHIFVLKPRHIEDPRIEDWGHELLHCTDGVFHPEGHRSKGRTER